MKVVTLTRAGRIRCWITSTGKIHKEEVYDVSIDGKQICRGVCVKYSKRVFGLILKPGETKTFIISTA